VLAAGLAGVLGGVAAFYWTSGGAGNAGIAACMAARPSTAAMAPLARGEV